MSDNKLKSLDTIIKEMLSKKTLSKDEIAGIIFDRMTYIVKEINLMKKRKFHVKKGRKYYYIKNKLSYGDMIEAKIDITTGDIFTPGSSLIKPLGNILISSYSGREYYYKNWGTTIEFSEYHTEERLKELRKGSKTSIPIYLPKVEFSDKYTKTELSMMSNKGLILIYKNLGLKGYSGKRKLELIDSIIKYQM